jgi:hypothetical protein
MSDRLPYEEQLNQQWNDLPLPDENMAWEDMNRRLEEDDDKPITPLWLRGCGLWGMLSVILLGFGWWFFTQYTSNSKEVVQKTQGIPQQPAGNKPNTDANNESTRITGNQPADKINQVPTVPEKKNPDDLPQSGQPIISADKNSKRKMENDAGVSITASDVSVKKTKQVTLAKQTPAGTKTEILNTKKRNQIIEKPGMGISITPASSKTYSDTTKTPAVDKTRTETADSLVRLTIDSTKSDSTLTINKDSLTKKIQEEVAKNTTPGKDSAKQKSISFSAGIAEHQLLPIDGQKMVPYNAQGRKSSLSDYIPSVYFRMYKDGKWFLQSEFRYGAPQYNQEILYSQKGVPDSMGAFSLITSTNLKKTFYHQVPVSFNYFVLPNWSLGTGFVWNKFVSAVSVQDVVKRTTATGSDTVVSFGTVVSNAKADTNFSKSYFQAIIETQYKWKRFSMGARYSFGLQPYLKFTLPGGTQQREKNRSLQVFLRYELWRSKKIMKK